MKLLYTILLSFAAFILNAQQQPVTVNPNGVAITVNPNGTSITFTPTIGGIAVTANFSFTLSQPAMTSAGVYKGDTLITTLWSLQYYSAGQHDTIVTGIDQNNLQLPTGHYKIKVLSNNVGYSDIGTYMNSSSNFHGSNTWRGELMSNLSFLGKHGFCGISYCEASWPIFRFNTDSIYQKSLISGQESYTYSGFSATDNNLVYWVTRASNQDGTGRGMNFIYATDTAGIEHVFPNGQGYNTRAGAGNPHASVVDTCGDLTDNTPRDCYGFTVQKNGNYMFAVRGIGINVTNKSGQFVRTVAITDGSQMKVDQTNDTTAWLIEGNQVKRYKIGSDGSLTYFGITINGMTTPLALDVSPTDNTLKVVDGGTQQVWFFNKATGAFIKTIGRLNGYYGNVLVDDTSFMFSNDFDIFPNQYPQFITHQPDGTFWVADNGNNRYQHFSANGTYLNNIHWLDRNYNLYADESDSTLLYIKATQIKIDITKTPQLGSYPIKNYMARMKPLNGSLGFFNIFNVGGHKFSTLAIANSDQQFVELKDTGLRYTGINLSSLGGGGGRQCMDNGDLIEQNATFANGNFASWYWAIKTCTGLDGNNNPTWSGSYTTLATVSGSTDQPVYGNNNNLRAMLSDGTIIGLNDHGHSHGYHLGAIRPNSNSWLWLTQPSTDTGYSGNFPKDYFDTWNAVNDYAGGQAVVKDDIIYQNYHGENWKQKQTNIVNLYYKDGLEIGEFGITGVRAEDGDAPYWLTGNTSHTVVLRNSSGHLFVENDESKCGGLMVTQVSNLASIRLDSFDVVVNGLSVPPAGSKSDLLSGFPYNALINSTEADIWTFSNPYYDSSSVNGHSWNLRTSYGTYTKNLSPDIYMNNFGSYNFGNCSLPFIEGNNWQLNQYIALPDVANGMFSPSSYFYYKIMDAAQKIIVQISVENQPFGQFGAPHALMVNNHVLYTDSSLNANAINIPLMNYLSITRSGSNITFNYLVNGVNHTVTTPIFDSTADAGQPQTLMLEHIPGGQGGTICDLAGMIFNNNYIQ